MTTNGSKADSVNSLLELVKNLFVVFTGLGAIIITLGFSVVRLALYTFATKFLADNIPATYYLSAGLYFVVLWLLLTLESVVAFKVFDRVFFKNKAHTLLVWITAILLVIGVVWMSIQLGAALAVAFFAVCLVAGGIVAFYYKPDQIPLSVENPTFVQRIWLFERKNYVAMSLLVALIVAYPTVVYNYWRFPKFLGGGEPSCIQLVFKDPHVLLSFGLLPEPNQSQEVLSEQVQYLLPLTDGIMIYKGHTVQINNDVLNGTIDCSKATPTPTPSSTSQPTPTLAVTSSGVTTTPPSTPTLAPSPTK